MDNRNTMDNTSNTRRNTNKTKTMNEEAQKKANEFAKEEFNIKEDETQLFEQIPIENSPFTAVKMEDKWFLTMGKYRLTEPLKSLEECRIEAKDASWLRIMQIMKIMIEEDHAERAYNNMHNMSNGAAQPK